MTEKKTDKTETQNQGAMARLNCNGATTWGNWAPKSKMYRCTKCGQTGHGVLR